MTNTRSAVPRGEPAPAANAVRRVLHWYDLVCPFCYVGQKRNTIFASRGFDVIDIPFQAHPEIPPGGCYAVERSDLFRARIEKEAQSAGLPLVWPRRTPNTRMALAAAEWARRHAPQSFPAFQRALFAAHFALGEDLGDKRVINAHAAAAAIDVEAMQDSLDSGCAYTFLRQSEMLAKSVGVRGTPAWFAAGRLIPGLYPREQFEQLAQSLANA